MQRRGDLVAHALIGLDNQRPLAAELIDLLEQAPRLLTDAEAGVPDTIGDREEQHRDGDAGPHDGDREARVHAFARYGIVIDDSQREQPGRAQRRSGKTRHEVPRTRRYRQGIAPPPTNHEHHPDDHKHDHDAFDEQQGRVPDDLHPIGR